MFYNFSTTEILVILSYFVIKHFFKFDVVPPRILKDQFMLNCIHQLILSNSP